MAKVERVKCTTGQMRSEEFDVSKHRQTHRVAARASDAGRTKKSLFRTPDVGESERGQIRAPQTRQGSGCRGKLVCSRPFPTAVTGQKDEDLRSITVYCVLW